MLTIKLKCRFLLAGILVFIVSNFGIGQDIIIKKDGDKVKAKILEINDTQIKYKEFRDINNLIFTIDRALIKEIRFETGKKYKEVQPGSSEVYYADDRINNLKLNFLSIGGGIVFTFERAIDAGSSWEATLKYLYPEFSWYNSNKGMGINVGYKLKTGNIFKYSDDYRPKHILNGGYIRLGIGYSRKNRSYGKVGIDLGRQWILRNSISIDAFLGYHYTSSERTIDEGDLIGEDNRAFAYGVRIGGLFTKKGMEKKKKR